MTFIPTPFTNPVVSPQATAGSAFRQIPYISVSEFRFAPTATSTSALVQGGDSADSAASTAQVISRVSGWVDEYCFHRADGTLAASVTTEWDQVKVKPNGDVVLICNFKPILAVVGLGWGPNPASMASVSSPAAQNLWFTDKTITIPNCAASVGTFPVFFGGGPPSSSGGVLFATWQYINGFPHMALAANATAGATTITVTPAVYGQIAPAGVYANTQLTIRDGTQAETVVVSTTPTSTTLTLSAPLQYSHTVPAAPDAVMVSAMPWAVEEACISLASVLVKAQGSRAMMLGKIGTPATREGASRAGAVEDYDRAMGLLKPFQSVYLHG